MKLRMNNAAYAVTVPEPHKFEPHKPPTLTTTGSDEVKILHDARSCKVCGLLRQGDWHIEDGQETKE